MGLIKCESFWGGDIVFEAGPSTENHDVAFYMPYTGQANWGIFDSSGTVIGSSCDYRTWDRQSKFQNVMATINPDHITEVADHTTMIYGGRFNPHFGHFLIDFLSRFWNCVGRVEGDIPILCHDTGEPASWFKLPFVADIMGELGLKPSSFVVYDRPIRVTNLIIPHTSFREQAFAHRAFGHLCAEIGARLLGTTAPTAARKIYLSKSRLRGGVGHISDEHVLEEQFSAAEFEIVYPENCSMKEQIALFNQEGPIVTTIGSALHTSIFAPPSCRIIALSTNPTPNSNFSLFDQLRQRRSEYYYAEGTCVSDPEPGFLSTYQIPELKQVAKQLINIASEAFQG